MSTESVGYGSALYKVVKVNAFQMQEIIGKSECRLLVYDGDHYYPGQKVLVKVFTESDDQPTGLWVHRWVIDSQPMSIHVDDDVVYALVLSAFKPEDGSLGLSRVRSSDNLESF